MGLIMIGSKQHKEIQEADSGRYAEVIE